MCSLRKNVDIVRELTKNKIDIIFLQETFTVDEKLGELDFIDEFYESVGVGAVFSDKSLVSMSGRPKGGMACLWRKGNHFKVDKIVLDRNLCVFSISVANYKIVLVNVYLNSDIWETATLTEYLENLIRLETILSDFEYDCMYFIGDFNADPFTGRAWGNLREFMERNSLTCFDYDILDSDTFTFTNYGDSHCKWLDHIIGRGCQGVIVKDLQVHYDLIGSDHLPISMTLEVNSENIDCPIVQNIGTVDEYHGYIDWKCLKTDEVKVIETLAMDIMGNFLNMKVNQCCNVGCRKESHLSQIDDMYELLVTSVLTASRLFHKRKVRKFKFKVIPGWNRNIKQLHSLAREQYLKWLELGRHRNTVQFDRMKESRKTFKNALKDCKVNEFRETCISIEERFKNKQMNNFWREVKQKKCKSKMSNVIDGKNDSPSILNIFTDKFLKLPNDNNEIFSVEEQGFIEKLKEKWRTSRKFHVKVSASTIRKLCKSLNSGMGHDGIHSSFLCSLSDEFLNNIACLMNCSFVHCSIPVDILKGDINPTIKDVKGNTTESSNYRPVMQSSCILKLFELHLLSILEEKTSFNFRQYGFRKGCSTGDACYILKETAYEYIRNRGKAFAAFIDLSKAFDMVDHLILGEQLLDRNIPPDIVFIIMHYLRNQRARICWSDSKGPYLNIDKGVRQGGILSPFLFKLYIDDVIHKLSSQSVGCQLGFLRANIIAYADDLVILSDTLEHLEYLYSILEEGLSNLKLLMNKNKSKCMIFRKTVGNNPVREVRLKDDSFEVVSQYKYLGYVIQESLMDDADVKFRLNTFYSQFNSVFRNFNKVSIETFLFLFNAYCLPEYGLSLWNAKAICNRQIFRSFETAFSNSLKKVVGVPFYSSSHVTAEMCRQLLFKHHYALLQARFVKRVLSSKNEINMLCLPYLKNGYLCESVLKLFTETYECNIYENDLDVLEARLEWVQKHENRRGVCHFYGV